MVLNMIIIVLLYVVIVRLYEIRASAHTSVEATQKAYDTSQLALTSVAYLENFKVVSSEFYFHKPITVHIELYLFYRFIHFLLYIGQY